MGSNWRVWRGIAGMGGRERRYIESRQESKIGIRLDDICSWRHLTDFLILGRRKRYAYILLLASEEPEPGNPYRKEEW